MQTPPGDNLSPSPPGRTRRRRLAAAALVLLLLPASIILLALVFLSSPPGVSRLAGELSRILGQPVTIGSLGISGTAITLRHLAVANAPPFRGELLTIRELTLLPSRRLLSGEKEFSLLELNGVTLDLRRDASAGWNFAPLVSRLQGMKGGGETIIGTLRLRDGAILVNGHRLPLLAVTVRDLATKGSRRAQWEAVLSEGTGHRLDGRGTVRPGPDPAATVTLETSGYPLGDVAPLLPGHFPLDLREGSATLHLSATYAGGDLKGQATLGMGDVRTGLTGQRVRLAGTAGIAAEYRRDRDQLTLSRVTLALDHLGSVSGRGSVAGVKGSRSYAVHLSGKVPDVGAIQALFPARKMKGVGVRGSLAVPELALEGDARQAVRSCRGTAVLKNGDVTWQGKRLLERGTVRMAFGTAPGGWTLTGTVGAQGSDPSVQVQRLAATLTILLSPRMKPVRVEAAPITARVRGIDVIGTAAFDATTREPLSLTLRAPSVTAADVATFMPERLRLQGGTASLTLAAKGTLPGPLHGTLTARLAGVAGEEGGRRFTLDAGTLDARFRTATAIRDVQAGGDLSATGTLGADPAEVGLTFAATPRHLRISRGNVRLGGTRVAVASLEGTLPAVDGTTRAGTPVRLALQGVTLSRDHLLLEDLAGSAEVGRSGDEGPARFTGWADLTARRASWQGWAGTGLAARLQADRSGVTGTVTGDGLGGRLHASGKVDPYDPGLPATLHLDGERLSAGELMSSWGKKLPMTVSEGVLGATAEVSYAKGAGVGLTCAVTGHDLAVNRGRKTLLGGMGLSAEGEYRADAFTLRRGAVTVGDKIAVALSGRVGVGPKRTGTVTVRLAPAPLSAVLDATANMLPAPFQAARADGTIAVNGAVELSGGVTSVAGEVSLREGALSLPDQQFSAEGMAGTLPFSVALPGPSGKLPRREHGFSREGYTKALASLRGPWENPTFRLSRVRFGPLEIGDIRLSLHAAGSRNEVTRLEAGFYGGTILGRGGLSWDHGPRYDADFLVNDLSLRDFCAAIPAIKGYLSGKVDGVAGLHGEGGGMNGLLGYVSLWTRSGKDEEMLISRAFLQKLAGKNLKGFFFRDDRPFDRGELGGVVKAGALTVTDLDISHTNFLGIRDLSVTVAPLQNRIALDHLISSIRAAARRGKPGGKTNEPPPQETPPATEFKWLE